MASKQNGNKDIFVTHNNESTRQSQNEASLAEVGVELSVQERHIAETAAQSSGLPMGDIALMIEAIRRGETSSEFFGIDEAVLNRMEQIGLGFYRSKQYADARRMFVAVLYFGQMHDHSRPGALRALAACDHSERYYLDAIELYEQALLINPDDLVSLGAMSECLCHVGKTQEGLSAAHALLSQVDPQERQAPYVLRAKALIQARGGQPLANAQRRRVQPLVTLPQAHNDRRTANPLTREVVEAMQAPKSERSKDASVQGSAAHGKSEGSEAPHSDETISDDEAIQIATEAAFESMTRAAEAAGIDTKTPELQALLAEPNGREMLNELTEAFFEGRITIKDIADFSDEQIDASYAMACRLVSSGDYGKALQLSAYMTVIDSHDPRFYRLSGLCMQHLKLWPLADFFYKSALIWGGGQPDPTTWLYQGEVALMMGEPERAVRLLTAGLEAAKGKSSFLPLVQRGTALLRQIAGGRMGEAAATAQVPQGDAR